jgi:hypothetical protein
MKETVAPRISPDRPESLLIHAPLTTYKEFRHPSTWAGNSGIQTPINLGEFRNSDTHQLGGWSNWPGHRPSKPRGGPRPRSSSRSSRGIQNSDTHQLGGWEFRHRNSGIQTPINSEFRHPSTCRMEQWNSEEFRREFRHPSTCRMRIQTPINLSNGAIGQEFRHPSTCRMEQ